MNNRTDYTSRPFRFPFDIDRRIFLALAALFFILAIRPINQLIFPRLSTQVIAKKVENDLNERIVEFKKLTTSFSSRASISQILNEENLYQLSKRNWSLLIYKNDSLINWTNAIHLTEDNEFVEDSIYIRNEVGTINCFLKQEKKLDNISYSFVGVFPIYNNFDGINSSFLKSHFAFTDGENAEPDDFGYKLSVIEINKKKNAELQQIKINQTPRLVLEEKGNFQQLTDKNFLHFFLAAIPFILFGVSIHTYYKVSVKRKPLFYLSLLIGTAIGVRAITLWLGFPDDFHDFYLFSQELYSGNILDKSLGDIFINTCLLFWILFFFIMNIQNKVFRLKTTIQKYSFIAIISGLLALVGYLSIFYIHRIVNKSLLDFDTTNTQNLTPFMIIGLGTILLIFMNYVLCAIIYNKYFVTYIKSKWLKYAVPIIAAIIVYFLTNQTFFTPFLYGAIWTILLVIFLNLKFLNSRFDFNSYKLVYWLIFLSLSCVLFIFHFEAEKELRLRKQFAEKIIHFKNPDTEATLKDLNDKIKQDSDLLNINAAELKNHIETKYLNTLDPLFKSTVLIQTLQEEKDNKDFLPFSTITDSSNCITVHPNLFFNNSLGKEEYILSIEKGNHQIIISLKNPFLEKANSTNPIVDKKYYLDNEPVAENYLYAFYENDSLITQSGLERFPIKLNYDTNPLYYRNGIFSAFTDVIANNNSANSNKTVIIRKKSNAYYIISTSYAYVFTIIFLLVSLYILGNIVARSNLRRRRLINLLGLTMRMRIHLSILLVELISLTLIGLITIYIFNSNSKQKALANAYSTSEEVGAAISQLENVNNKSTLSSDSINTKAINASINLFLDKHEVDVNIFDLNGCRIYSTVPDRVKSILPRLMNPIARLLLEKKENAPALLNEKIGSLNYYTIYSFIRNKQGDKIGFLEIPNFKSFQSIKQNNSDIVTMLINIYAFIFLLSSLFAFYITQRLTKSFSHIVSQFSKINLMQTNEPLSWPYSDEIGLLIKEYNRTLRKLENSTALLAKSERELAWREMAKQIAHEIKNPLTPMSLSLQSLQMAIKRNDPNIRELTEKMTVTVLDQINVLARTASNFSEFAKMIDIDAKEESLNEILTTATGIYSDNDEAEFLFVLPKKDITVHVDKVKIIRVITNVIQNAIQSIPSNRLGQIMLAVTKEANNMVKITIEDNGDGIPIEYADKIFEPNFTTKNFGSGLGLAMCKDIMLKTGGNIYFESKEGEGSRFHIEIPEYTADASDDIPANEDGV